MNRRILIGLTVLALGVAATGAQAGEHHRHDYGHRHDHAARAEHWRYDHRERMEGPNGGTIIGGVLGAVIGHNIATDDNRPVATLAGALVGAAIGSELGRRDHDHRGHGYR